MQHDPKYKSKEAALSHAWFNYVPEWLDAKSITEESGLNIGTSNAMTAPLT